MMKALEVGVVEDLFGLSRRVIIVTGGGKGIGKVYSWNLAKAGARVVIADIDHGANQELEARIVDSGGEAIALETDVTVAACLESVVDAALSKWGRIDGLVNNAALMSVLERKPWDAIDVGEWDRVMEVNLRGMFLACRAVFPQMKKQRYGKIVNLSSGRVFEGTPFRLHYTTSKAGVIGYTRALAREVGEFNICVNALSPGLTLSETQLAQSDPEYLRKHGENRALGRAQTPDDLLGPLFFLLASGSDFMTGQTINVDGGRAMH